MTFALVGARCDRGGLATITSEMYRNLLPDRTLVLDLGNRGRSEAFVRLYDEPDDGRWLVRCEFNGGIPDPMSEWIAAPGVDVLFGVETWYDDKVVRYAKRSGVRTVMLAMPELAPWAHGSPDRPHALKPDVLLVPTDWRLESLPEALVLPVPVARDRLQPTLRTQVEHLYHVTGVAMLDRNGTDLLLKALPMVRNQCRLTIRSERPLSIPRHTNVDVEVVSAPAARYWEQYPDDIDVLVMPRRYGGLNLPLQECASLGVPSVVLASDPYAKEAFTFAVPTTRARDYQMKGGMVPVWNAEPSRLADLIDELIETPGYVKTASAEANAFAESIAWDGPVGQRWCDVLSSAACDAVLS